MVTINARRSCRGIVERSEGGVYAASPSDFPRGVGKVGRHQALRTLKRRKRRAPVDGKKAGDVWRHLLTILHQGVMEPLNPTASRRKLPKNLGLLQLIRAKREWCWKP